MADQNAQTSLKGVLTRRRLLAAGGTSAVALLAAPRILAHGDDDDNSGHGGGDNHGDDHGEDSHDNDSDDRNSDDDGKVQPNGQVPAGSIAVEIVDDDADAFQPGTVTIDLGQSVTWVNLDDDEHTATGAGFDTGIIQPGDLVTITFDTPGSFPYSCQIHPIMVGRVEVRDANGDVPNSAAASPEASPQASPTAGDTAAVSIANVAFDPAQLEVAVGTTVTWTNEEAVPHTVTAVDGAFDSGTLEQGDTFEETFSAAGTFEYACAIHPGMKGSIVVS
jgi:plastocyanin